MNFTVSGHFIKYRKDFREIKFVKFILSMGIREKSETYSKELFVSCNDLSRYLPGN